MFVAIMAFHARISDPRVGGTYLTLLNTLTNLGGNWCQTLALWLVDGLTWTNCVGATIPGLHCSSKTSAKVQALLLKMSSFVKIFCSNLCFQPKTDSCCLFQSVSLHSEPCRFGKLNSVARNWEICLGCSLNIFRCSSRMFWSSHQAAEMSKQ